MKGQKFFPQVDYCNYINSVLYTPIPILCVSMSTDVQRKAASGDICKGQKGLGLGAGWRKTGGTTAKLVQ